MSPGHLWRGEGCSEQSGTKHACEDVAMIEIDPLRPGDRDAYPL